MADWSAYLREGYRHAEDHCRAGTELTDEHAMWALLCEAARDTERSAASPPRSGYPAKSAGFSEAGDASLFALWRAYFAGDIEEAPEASNSRPRGSAHDLTRGEAVLALFYGAALQNYANGRYLRHALFFKAKGWTARSVQAEYGITAYQQRHAKDRAMRDMIEAIGRVQRMSVAQAVQQRDARWAAG